MIFVTVGTTLVFDDLVEAIDHLVGSGVIEDEVICQIGNGEYNPAHCESFRFKPSVDDLIERASLVICHGGTGSTLGVLAKGKRFIAVANPKGVDNHQAQFLERLSHIVPILWTHDLNEMPNLLNEVNDFNYENMNIPCLVNDLNSYLRGI